MDKPHSGQMENDLIFKLQQQNEFLKRQLACSEAARERLEKTRKEIQEKERALRASKEEIQAHRGDRRRGLHILSRRIENNRCKLGILRDGWLLPRRNHRKRRP